MIMKLKIWLFKQLYKSIAKHGREGDTELAHVNSYEIELLKSAGGSGTINPTTGLREFKGGGGGGTQVQRNEPSAIQAPYLSDLYSQAQTQFQAGPQQFFPGQTYATPSDTTIAAEQAQKQAAIAQGALGIGSIVPGFQQALMSPAQRFQDPMLQQSLAASLRPIEESGARLLQQARRSATGKGQLGGTRQAILESEVIRDMTQKQADVASRLYGDVYGDVLRTQAATLGLSPSIMSSFSLPAQTLAQVGASETARAQQPITEAMQRFAFNQAAPGQALQQYGNIVAGSILPGTITTQGPGTQGPGALAGAASGAMLGNMIMPGIGGAIGGAVLGGLLG
tara:strand:+ start:424 stop:1440 length:1017 start_codon:yes stop_codon:yes gene_type:complete